MGSRPSQFGFPNDPNTVHGVLKKLPRGTKIAVEATGSWWWFVEKARELGHEVCLSHPKQTKAIAHARLKSDKVDGVMLAQLLKADFLPTVWIPGERERYVRELLAHRARLGRTRTAVINELHAVYAKRNIEVPGMIWHRIRPVAWRAEELSGYGPRIVTENAELLKLINQQIQNLDKELAKAGQEDPQANRLMTIPGVGVATGMAVSCWIGDIRRFPSAKKLVSYFGIAPPKYARAQIGKPMGTSAKRVAAWCAGLFAGRARRDPDVEGTWTWAILGSITATGKEDCPDRCSPQASRNDLSHDEGRDRL